MTEEEVADTVFSFADGREKRIADMDKSELIHVITHFHKRYVARGKLMARKGWFD